MNILHVYKTYSTESTGGVEKVIQQLCSSTTARGVNNRIFCLTSAANPAVLEQPEASIFRSTIDFDVASTPFSFSALSLFKSLTQWADVIHYQYPWPFADLLHLLSRTKKPALVTYQSDIVRQKLALIPYYLLQRYFLTAVDKIIATSPQYLASSPVLQKFAAKTTVIPIGLEKSSYPVPTAERLQYWQQRFSQPFFLFVGVMRYYKGLHILLDACKNASFKVVLAGSGPMEAQLKAQAQQLNLTNVTFLGRISDEDKIALLQLSRGVVFPSHLRSEAFGVSLLEGAMYGKPLISSEISTGTSYINAHGEVGLVVPPNNPEALRQAMLYIDSHPQEAQQMGERALQRYQDYFTADIMADRYMRAYESIMRQVTL